MKTQRDATPRTIITKMPFKRKARILFASSKPYPAAIAARYANSAGASWLVAFAVAASGSTSSEGEYEFDGPGLALADASRLEFDLIITLDDQVITELPVWPDTPRHRHYPVSSQGADLIAEIQRLVEGIIGGFKLLEKSAVD